MLEAYYDVRVASMTVVCTHPDNGATAFVDVVPLMAAETEVLMANQRLRVAQHRPDLEATRDVLGGSAQMDSHEGPSFEEMLEESMDVAEALEVGGALYNARCEEEYQDTGAASSGSARPAPAASSGAAPPVTAASSGAAPPVTAASSVAAPPAFSISSGAAPPADEEDVDDDDEMDGPPDSMTQGPNLRARRDLPGAATSGADFGGLWSIVAQLMPTLSAATRTPEPKAVSIIARTKHLESLVIQHYPTWVPAVRRLAVAALSVYRMRLIDISLCDHVYLLWIICGERMLRAHNGASYYYNAGLGVFEHFIGFMPHEILEDIRVFTMRLEGLFRSFNGHVARDDVSLLDAVNASLASHDSAHAAFLKFDDYAIGCRGNHLLKKARGADGPDDDLAQGGDHETFVKVWYIQTAQATAKVGSQLQVELMQNKLISFFIQWCDTPMVRSKGVCYEDAVYLYDVDGQNISFRSERSPDHNVYLGIRCTLLDGVDPVLKAAMDRVQTCYQQTFWSIPTAFRFGQACQALAKRGHNVDTITLYWGAGGVGLSLYTAHLHAMYGPANHKYFDPNVFYQDDELRKTIETLVGGIIYTGQERPSGGRQSLREDLLKKFATGEGISGRLPYGMVTKLHHILGWKRMELNKLIQFDDVTEQNFESIIRRIVLIKILARFFDKKYLERYNGNHEQFGIFARDPDLKDFMTSGPAQAAGHKIQWAFESQNNEQECRDLVTTYARCGGDRGTTNKYMRLACKLPPANEVDDGPPDLEELVVDETQRDGAGVVNVPASDALSHYSRHFERACMEQNLNHMAWTHFFHTSLPPPPAGLTQHMPKKEIWKRFLDDGLWLELRMGNKGNRIPVIKVRRSLDVLFAPMPLTDSAPVGSRWQVKHEEEDDNTYPEEYDLANCKKFFFGNPARKLNSDLLCEVHAKHSPMTLPMYVSSSL